MTVLRAVAGDRDEPFSTSASGRRSCAPTAAKGSWSQTGQRNSAHDAAGRGRRPRGCRPGGPGSVSTSAATIAAAIGRQDRETSAGRRCHSRPAPPGEEDAAAAPQTANAALPLTVFLRFHGQRVPPMACPASVATPSPAARMPHAAATMSGRRREQQDQQDDCERIEDDAVQDAALRRRAGRARRRYAAGRTG